MFRKFTLYLFLLLSSIGLTYDTQSYTSGALSGSAYGIIGLSTLIALCYILPGIFLVRYLGKRWQVKPLVLIFALIGGVFITGWIAGYANTISHDWVTAHLSSKSFFYRFEDALMAPLGHPQSGRRTPQTSCFSLCYLYGANKKLQGALACRYYGRSWLPD